MARLTISAVRSIKAEVERFADRHRHPLLLLGFVILVGGVGWSIQNLGLEIDQISWLSILLALVIYTPFSVLLNGLELKACASAVQREMPARTAVRVTSYGTVANVLPLPASLAIRTHALVRAGAPLGDAVKILSLSAVLWLASAIAVTAFFVSSNKVSIFVLLASVVGLLCFFVHVGRTYSFPSAAQFIVIRAAMFVVFILRALTIFAGLGVAAALGDAAVLSGAGIASSIVGVIPAGFGVSESVGAALASVRDASPAAAFLVLAIDRALNLLASGLAALGLSIGRQEQPAA